MRGKRRSGGERGRGISLCRSRRTEIESKVLIFLVYAVIPVCLANEILIVDSPPRAGFPGDCEDVRGLKN